MKTLQLVIEGGSEVQIQKDIERMTRGWRLFFVEPTGAKYEFIQSFWGYPWDGTSEDLKKAITEGTVVGDRNKHHICVFKYDGEDRFAWCSWTKEVYDFSTGEKYKLASKGLARQITLLINSLF